MKTKNKSTPPLTPKSALSIPTTIESETPVITPYASTTASSKLRVGQCEYTTQLKGSFWCHIIDTKGAVLLLIFINKFVLVCTFHSHLGN